MKKNTKVSVIIACLNDKGGLEKTINSYIKQNYRFKELIVIDGGSNDGTVNIIKKYKNYIDYWISEKDSGISDAFNKGIMKSKGDYLYFIGTGDYFWTDNSIKAMMEDSDYKKDLLVCGRINRVGSKDQKIIYTTDAHFNKVDLLYKMGLPHQGLFTSKLYFKKYGLFDTELKYSMDYDLLLRAYKTFPRVNIKNIIVAAWRDGGIGENKTQDVLKEYRYIKNKNKVSTKFVIEMIYIASVFKHLLGQL